jgi:VCBS repeat-containing protein
VGISIFGNSAATGQKYLTYFLNGQFFKADTNGSVPSEWLILGGSTPHTPDFQFSIDQFQVISNGTTEFDDQFGSSTPPDFTDGASAQYALTSGAPLANNGSSDLLLGSDAVLIAPATNIYGELATLNTDTTGAAPANGLYSGTSFTTQGTFALVLPTDTETGYGIDLTDGTAGDGHDIVALEVEYYVNQVDVELQQINNVTGSVDILQSIALDPSAGDDQIRLALANNGTVNNGQVSASFTLLDNGVVDSTTNFTATGSIFVGENGSTENWTQPGFRAIAPGFSDSILKGTYGTLDIAQDGVWTYAPNSSQAGVQALAQGTTVIDNFTIGAADVDGAFSSTPLTITLEGANPSLSVAINGTIGEGAQLDGGSFSQFLGFGDSGFDTGYFLTHPISANTTTQALYNAGVAAGGGIPTSLGGVMNTTLLAQDFRLTAIPVGETGGSNYAASGATVTGGYQGSEAPSIVSQMQTYLASVGNHANPDALYLVDGGANDAGAIAAFMDPSAGQAYMVSEANAMAQALEQLHADGAQYFVISDDTGGGEFGLTYLAQLQNDLSAAGIPFVTADILELISAVEANPAAYGIVDANEPPSGPFTYNAYNPADGGADVNPNPSVISTSWSLDAT